MIVAILIIGLALIASALQNTQNELAALLRRDLLGSQGFILWIAAVGALGAIGYIPGLERTSRNLILLLIVVVVLRNGGVWANAQAALQGASQQGPAPSPVSPADQTASTSNANSSSGSGSGGGGILGDIGAVAGIASLF